MKPTLSRFHLPLTAAFLLLAAMARPLAADEADKDAKPNADTPKEAAKESQKPPVQAEEPKLFVTEHTAVINGKTIKYKATVGYLLLKQEAGDQHPAKADDSGKKPADDAQKDDLKPWAKIFFIAYTRARVWMRRRAP